MADYSDILTKSRPRSPHRAYMTLLDRAAQFSSFAALTGYEDVIEETGRLTDSFAQMDEGVIAGIDRQLQALSERINAQPAVTVTFFQPDAYKDGGSYQTKSGQLKAVDALEQSLRFTDRTQIPFAHILAITEC